MSVVSTVVTPSIRLDGANARAHQRARCAQVIVSSVSAASATASGCDTTPAERITAAQATTSTTNRP